MRNVCLFILTLCAGMIFAVSDLQAFPVLPFDSSGWVDPSYNNSWNPVTATGTARYFFYFDNPSVRVNELALQFEGDVFNLSLLTASDFNMVVPAGWNSTMFVESPGVYKWSLSGGNFVDPASSPLILDVNYTLVAANRFSFGDNIYAGDPTVWAWNEAQGANSPWSNKYSLSGKMLVNDNWYDAMSGGSTSPIPEPGTMVLLGISVLSFAGYAKARMK